MALSTDAVSAFGVELAVCADASGTTPVAIARLKDVSWTRALQMEETTTHDSGNPNRTYIGTLLMTKVEVSGNWVGSNATHEDLLEIQDTRAERTYILTPSDGSPAYQFNALIESIKLDHGISAVRAFSCSFQGSGVVDLDA